MRSATTRQSSPPTSGSPRHDGSPRLIFPASQGGGIPPRDRKLAWVVGIFGRQGLVDLSLDQGSDLWPIHADEAQLSNAIINLVRTKDNLDVANQLGQAVADLCR